MNNIQINIENYEAFALDYLEGNLSVEERQAFDQFLSAQPDIEEELSGLLDYRVERVGLTYKEKEQLKKRVGISLNGRFGLFSIAASILLLAAVFMMLHKGDQASTDMAIDNSSNENHIEFSQDKIEINEQLSHEVHPHKNEISNQIAVETPADENNEEDTKNKLKRSNSTHQKSNQVSQEMDVAEQATSTQSINKIQLNKSIDKKQHNADQMAIASNEKNNDQSHTPIPSQKNNVSLDQNESTIIALNPVAPVKPVVSDNERNKSIDNNFNNDNIKYDNDDERAIAEHIPAVNLLKPNLQLSIPSNIEEHKMAALSASLPVINIPDEQQDDEALIASADAHQEDKSKSKKLKIRFRNFLPEQFAGLTKGDIKRSLIPETFTAR